MSGVKDYIRCRYMCRQAQSSLIDRRECILTSFQTISSTSSSLLKRTKTTLNVGRAQFNAFAGDQIGDNQIIKIDLKNHR